MQHGLESSSGRDGLNCWSSWYDSSGWAGEATGFLWWGVTPRRDGGMQPTAARVIVRILTVLAVRAQRLMGNPLGRCHQTPAGLAI